MTEKQWLACEDAEQMLSHLADQHAEKIGESDQTARSTGRKPRLFAIACCRRVEHLLTDNRSRNAIEIVEQYVDGQATKKQRNEAAVIAGQVMPEGACDGRLEAALAVWSAADDIDEFAAAAGAAVNARDAIALAMDLSESSSAEAYERAEWAEQSYQASLVRDIFGNPFRTVTLNPAWLTSDVLALAQGMYDERAFDRMPILADALQDAGCENDEVLTHCRDQHATHVRGCWVVDLVLGRA